MTSLRPRNVWSKNLDTTSTSIAFSAVLPGSKGWKVLADRKIRGPAVGRHVSTGRAACGGEPRPTLQRCTV
jgi:hypothetical protein